MQVYNTSRYILSLDQNAHTCSYFLSGGFTGNSAGDPIWRNFRANGSLLTWYGGGTQESDTIYTNHTGPMVTQADKTGQYWATVYRIGGSGGTTDEAAPLYFKSDAVTATCATPTSNTVTGNSANISCTYYPNVLDSTCTAQLQMKRTIDPYWTAIGTPNYTGGYSIVTCGPEAVTGLLPNTSYDVRLVVVRTTNNATVLYSPTHVLVTSTTPPTVTTVAANGVADTSAVLNATVTMNDQSAVTLAWLYGTSNPPIQGVGDTVVATYSGAITANGSYDKTITGLSANTTYYFYAAIYWASTGANGSVLYFTTPDTPIAVTTYEDHMQNFEYDRKYKTATTVYFTVASPGATSSDRWFNAASPFVAGDVQISKDGGGFANIGTLPTRIGSTAVFSMPLTATEMEATDIIVQIVDQNGPAFRDALLHIRTKIQSGQLDIDASQIGSSASAITLTPATGGYGLSGTASPAFNPSVRSALTQAGSGGTSVVLDASASGTDDFYNGCIILITSGTGAGQARVITDYAQTTKTATVNKTWGTTPGTGDGFTIIPGNDLWEVSPGIELAALPTSASSFGKILQFLFQRFAYKRTQTSTTHTMYKSDSSTSLATTGVTDSGGTQTFGKLS